MEATAKANTGHSNFRGKSSCTSPPSSCVVSVSTRLSSHIGGALEWAGYTCLDASSTVSTFVAQRTYSATMQVIHRVFVASLTFDSIIIDSWVDHVNGESNPLADAASRGQHDRLRSLVLQLDIEIKPIPLNESALQFISQVMVNLAALNILPAADASALRHSSTFSWALALNHSVGLTCDQHVTWVLHLSTPKIRPCSSCSAHLPGRFLDRPPLNKAPPVNVFSPFAQTRPIQLNKAELVDQRTLSNSRSIKAQDLTARKPSLPPAANPCQVFKKAFVASACDSTAVVACPTRKRSGTWSTLQPPYKVAALSLGHSSKNPVVVSARLPPLHHAPQSSLRPSASPLHRPRRQNKLGLSSSCPSINPKR